MDDLIKLKKLNIPTAGQINFGDGEIRLDMDGYPAVISIGFQGDAKFVSKLPGEWIYVIGRNKIIAYTQTETKLPSILFTYTKTFKPVSCKVIGWDQKQINIKLNPVNINIWGLMKTRWSDCGGVWSNYNRSFNFKGSNSQNTEVS